MMGIPISTRKSEYKVLVNTHEEDGKTGRVS